MKYRKTALIDAMQWTGENAAEVAVWLTENEAACLVTEAVPGELDIKTLEDGSDGRAKHVASVGDWIAINPAREVYAIKPDVFEDTYEAAE